MKNIHVLTTDKPSRLGTFTDPKDTKLYLKTNPIPKFPHRDDWKPQNIYITSDEEIREGDWCLDKFNQRWKLEDERLIAFDSKGIKRFSTDNILGHDCKKIILTTDPKLIKDGVQAIDDEFLEWFIKNPSCEEVEVEGHIYKGQDETEYKIIIPSEEPKQETLEEAIEQYAEIYRCPATNENEYCKHDIISAINFGAKWQQERSYSEEELLNLLTHFAVEIQRQNKKGQYPIEIKGWFERNKDKFKNK